MRFLLEPIALGTLDDALEAGEHARLAGLDGLLVAPSEALPAPLVTVAAVAARIPDLLLAAEVELGKAHPVELAEEAAVVDQLTRGRSMLVLRGEGLVDAALDQLQSAAVGVMPPPFGTSLAIWLAEASPQRAASRGMGHLAPPNTADEALAAGWAQASAAGRFVPRARRELASDPESLLRRLREGRAAFGQDWAVVSGSATEAAAAARYARPRVRLVSLPPGLEEHWEGPFAAGPD